VQERALAQENQVNTAQPNRYSGEDRVSDGAAEQPIIKSETRAKQGVTGQGVRYVLGWGLAAVVLAFAIVYFVVAAGH
jgi:hypothetical protein